MVEVDHDFMSRAIELAQAGIGQVSPNPLVGCVIVKDGKIIGEGFHNAIGQPHAEVHAIKSVKEPKLLEDSTLFVTLEPCNHQGRTPPCSNQIIEAGISKVVIGTCDPNDAVIGGGAERLRSEGIEVCTGVLEEKCRSVNRRYLTFHEKKRPHIVLKWAMTKSGQIANSNDKQEWISGPQAQILSHK